MSKLTLSAFLVSSLLASPAFAITGGLVNTDPLPAYNNTPPPACLKAPSKSFNFPLYSQSVANIPFTISATGSISLVADSTHTAAVASLGPGIQVFGFQDVRKPIDLSLTAGSTTAGVNSVHVSITAFGKTLASWTPLSTTSPLDYVPATLDWNLPNLFADVNGNGVVDNNENNGTAAHIGDSYDCPLVSDLTDRIRNCTVGWDLSATAIAEVAVKPIVHVGTSGLEVRALAAANAYGSLTGAVHVDAEVDDHLPGDPVNWESWSVDIDASASLDLIRLTFGGHAVLSPSTDHWTADAGASLAITDAMGALVKATVPYPIIGDKTYEIFKLTPKSYSDTYTAMCTLPRMVKIATK